jgi:hypothetical protein
MRRSRSWCPYCPLAACPQTNNGAGANQWWRSAARAEGAVVVATHGR